MVTRVDEGKGLVQVFWEDVRRRTEKVDPLFTRIIDKISPDHTYPIYLAYYRYGDIIGDTENYYLPKLEGGTYSLFNADVPKEVLKHLGGYSRNSLPFGMVLDKNIEYFIDYKSESISVPWVFYSPGKWFPYSRILSRKYNYSPNNVLTMTSGTRSAFMLPPIGRVYAHDILQREFNFRLPAPKSLYAQWNIFKALVNSEAVNSDWRSCLMFFSEKWENSLHHDEAWKELKLYLYERAWEYTEYSRNRLYYDNIFSVIQKKRNLKPNPYLTDTVRHLFAIALGASPGYAPATDNESLPLDILQKLYTYPYGLKYIPTILQPVTFDFEKDKDPVYYSFSYPSTNIFSPKARKMPNTVFEQRELEHITKIFREELAKESQICSGTIINTVAQQLEFNYFHTKVDSQKIVRPSADIAAFDERFNVVNADNILAQTQFCKDARFLRGCVSMNIKDFSKK